MIQRKPDFLLIIIDMSITITAQDSRVTFSDRTLIKQYSRRVSTLSAEKLTATSRRTSLHDDSGQSLRDVHNLKKKSFREIFTRKTVVWHSRLHV